MTLAPPPAPEDPAALRGRELFLSSRTRCGTCHIPPTFTDRLRHDVKSSAKGDTAREFDTPSLLGARHSAPYFHDGRYATLRDMLRATEGAMGSTKTLSEEELGALEAFLRSL
jgi:cytochrome c peroxidase